MAWLTDSNVTDYIPDHRLDAMFDSESGDQTKAITNANKEVERKTGIVQTDADYASNETLIELAASVFKYKNLDRLDMVPDHVRQQYRDEYKMAQEEMERIASDSGRLNASETSTGSNLNSGSFQRQITDTFI